MDRRRELKRIHLTPDLGNNILVLKLEWRLLKRET
jgi:hypothetical protein